MNVDALPITLTYPPALMLLVLAIVIYWLHRKSLRFLSPIRRRLSLTLRVLVLVLLVVAVTRPIALGYGSRLDVAFLVDISDSMSSQQYDEAMDWLRQSVRAKRSSDRYEIVAFAADAAVDQPLSSSHDVSDLRSELPADRTDLAAALRLASTSLPGSAPRRIVMFTDGGETEGDASAEALLAAAAGIPVSFARLQPRLGPEALVQQVIAPEHLREGDTFPLRVTIVADHATSAKLYITIDGQLDSTHDIALIPGSNTFAYGHEPLGKGFHSIRAHLELATDNLAENNDGTAYISVSGKGRVLLVEGTKGSSRFLTEALTAGGVHVEVRDPISLPADSPGLRNFDTVVLINVPGDRLTPPQQQTLASYVQNFGGGLVVTGGDSSFGAGAYARTPLEALLPVRSDLQGRELESSVALFIVIDRSGSMGEGPGAGSTKMDLAKRAAIDAVELLNERDQIGTLAFDDENTWVVPPTYLTDPDEVKRQIGTLDPGGGTAIYPALLEAYQALRERPAKVRHIILMTDGLAPEGDYRTLAAQIRAQNITVSTIAIGNDADLGLLQRLAEMGNGRYYEATDPFDVPQLIVKETKEISRAAIVEEAISVVADPGTSALLGVDLSAVPPLSGYVATTPKPASTVVLATAERDPLLAEWQAGLGRVIAWASDVENRWSSDWLAWPQFAQFWTAVVKRTIPADSGSDTQVTVENNAGSAEVRVDSRAEDGSYLNLLRSRAMVTLPDGAQRAVDLPQEAPGRYAGAFPVEQQGTYAIDVMQYHQDGSLVGGRTAGLAVSYAPEYGHLAGNLDLLRSIAQTTGGRELAGPAEAFWPDTGRSSRGEPLWPIVVALAMLFFLLDVATRRLRIEPVDVLDMLRRLPRLAQRPAVPVVDPRGERLLAVKRRIVPASSFARRRTATLGTITLSDAKEQKAEPMTTEREASTTSTSRRLMAAKKRASERQPPA